MNVITVDDLAKPEIPDAGQAILAERAKLPIEFSMDDVLENAEDTSDVPLYRDTELEDSLERFMLEADQKGELSKAGQKLLATEFANIIVQRSRLEHLIAANSEILDVEIKAPIIIAGIPRSGTTNLSNIIASDTRLRLLSMWESRGPFPSKDGNPLDGMSEDELMAMGEQALAGIYTVLPMARMMYDISFKDAMEELCLLAISGCPCMYMPQAYTPEWNRWFYNEMDPLPMYGLMQKALQALNWTQGSSKRWVLKTPHHLGFLPALTQSFPDCHLIITHRDPASSTVSNATMNAYAFRETHDAVDPAHGYQVAIDMADGMIGGLMRDFDDIEAASITQIHFHEYMADVMGTLETIYSRVGLPFTDKAHGELQAYIDAHPRGRHGAQLGYEPERDFGVTRDQIRERYQGYIDKFGVRVEQKHA